MKMKYAAVVAKLAVFKNSNVGQTAVGAGAAGAGGGGGDREEGTGRRDGMMG